MGWGRPCRACTQSSTHACDPSCELFLRHALTTRPLGGMFCGLGLRPRPPETIPSPPQSGPKFKPARYYSTSRVTPSSVLTASHCPEYHLPPHPPPRDTLTRYYWSAQGDDDHLFGFPYETSVPSLLFFSFLPSVVKMLATAELLGIES